MSYFIKHLVPSEKKGLRLDLFLKERYRKKSREQLKRSIDLGEISVQRRLNSPFPIGRVKPSSQLLEGDEILIRVDRKPEPAVNFNYSILYEDDVLFVINKPPLLPVHPAGRYFFNTLLIHLRTDGHRAPLNADQDYYLVHRIDKETSGILVLAKTKEACAQLTQQFAGRTIQKRYLAIVHGICPEEFTVDTPLMRAGLSSKIELKMICATEEAGGLPSLTSFHRKKFDGKETSREAFSLVECHPKTGRQHQIRVHLASIGHPIVGDKLYSLPESEALRFFNRVHLTPELEAKLLMSRHALHAAAITFKHPISGKTMTFEAPIPQDMLAFLEQRG